MTKLPEVIANVDAECAMLGSILIDTACLLNVAQIAQPTDCYDPHNAIVYEHILDLHNRRRPIDYITLVDALTQSGKLEQIGGVSFLIGLSTAVPSSVQAVHYAEIVAGTAARRRLLNAATEIAKIAHRETDSSAALTEAETLLYRIHGNKSSALVHVSQPAAELSAEFEQIASGDIPVALPTGYNALDDVLTGWRRQELTIIAARPGIGKTALLCNIATKAAQAGRGVALFSAEMSAKSLVKRMILAAGVRNLPGIVATNKIDWNATYGELAQISDLPLWIDDTPNPSVIDIRSKVMRLAYEQRIDIVAVDYVQLLRVARQETRYLEISAITKALKNMSRELDNHVIAAAQLSRNAEDSTPSLRDLKESGAQEEDSDNVILLHRQREIPRGIRVVETDAIIAKQRNGPTGKVTLGWYPERVCFVSMEKPKEATNGH